MHYTTWIGRESQVKIINIRLPWQANWHSRHEPAMLMVHVTMHANTKKTSIHRPCKLCQVLVHLMGFHIMLRPTGTGWLFINACYNHKSRCSNNNKFLVTSKTSCNLKPSLKPKKLTTYIHNSVLH